MDKFKNKQGITQITMHKDVKLFCPMGQDWYTAEICINLTPGEWIMDYCDIDLFIDSLEGDNLIIEDLIETIFDYIDEECCPTWLRVEAEVNNAAHMPVVVAKEF